jgi:replicative DNA helicase
MGKTELALDIIDKVSERGQGVLFFSLEMSSIQITERMVSAAGGMPVSRLKAADKFEDEDWARLTTGVGRLTGRKVWMVDATNLTLDQISQTATRWKIAHRKWHWWSLIIWRLSGYRVPHDMTWLLVRCRRG